MASSPDWTNLETSEPEHASDTTDPELANTNICDDCSDGASDDDTTCYVNNRKSSSFIKTTQIDDGEHGEDSSDTDSASECTTLDDFATACLHQYNTTDTDTSWSQHDSYLTPQDESFYSCYRQIDDGETYMKHLAYSTVNNTLFTRPSPPTSMATLLQRQLTLDDRKRYQSTACSNNRWRTVGNYLRSCVRPSVIEDI